MSQELSRSVTELLVMLEDGEDPADAVQAVGEAREISGHDLGLLAMIGSRFSGDQTAGLSMDNATLYAAPRPATQPVNP